MRDSFFTSKVSAVLEALHGNGQLDDERVNEILELIRGRLELLLDDDRTPERTWRQSVAEPLLSLARLMRARGTPTPSVEHLAAEMAV